MEKNEYRRTFTGSESWVKCGNMKVTLQTHTRSINTSCWLSYQVWKSILSESVILTFLVWIILSLISLHQSLQPMSEKYQNNKDPQHLQNQRGPNSSVVDTFLHDISNISALWTWHKHLTYSDIYVKHTGTRGTLVTQIGMVHTLLSYLSEEEDFEEGTMNAQQVIVEKRKGKKSPRGGIRPRSQRGAAGAGVESGENSWKQQLLKWDFKHG